MDPFAGVGGLVLLLLAAHVVMGVIEEVADRTRKVRARWDKAAAAPRWTRGRMTVDAVRGTGKALRGAGRAAGTACRAAGWVAAGVAVGSAEGWRAGRRAATRYHAARAEGFTRRQAFRSQLPSRRTAPSRLQHIPVDGPDEADAGAPAAMQTTVVNDKGDLLWQSPPVPTPTNTAGGPKVAERLRQALERIDRNLDAPDDSPSHQWTLERTSDELRSLVNDIDPNSDTPHASPVLVAVDGSATRAEQHSSIHQGGRTMTTMTGEAVNIEATRDQLDSISRLASQMFDAIENMDGSLAQAKLDPQTLSDIAALAESAESTKLAAERAKAGINSRHSHMEEAVASTAHVAETQWYRG